MEEERAQHIEQEEDLHCRRQEERINIISVRKALSSIKISLTNKV